MNVRGFNVAGERLGYRLRRGLGHARRAPVRLARIIMTVLFFCNKLLFLLAMTRDPAC